MTIMTNRLKNYLVFSVSLAVVVMLFSAIFALAASHEDVGAMAEEKMEEARERAGEAMEKSRAEEHRSQVSRVAAELRELAGKDRNIGEEIREVAMEQEESSEKAVEAMESAEKRNAFITFLFGTDYGSLGQLRSELVTTENHINRLTGAMERASDQMLKDDLQAQIDELQAAKDSVESFVREQENKFSLFGWLVRLFQ